MTEDMVPKCRQVILWKFLLTVHLRSRVVYLSIPSGGDAYVTIARFMQTRAKASSLLKLRTRSALNDFKGLRFVVAHGLRSHSRKVLGRSVTEVFPCSRALTKNKGRIYECNGGLRL